MNAVESLSEIYRQAYLESVTRFPLASGNINAATFHVDKRETEVAPLLKPGIV